MDISRLIEEMLKEKVANDAEGLRFRVP